MRKSIAAGGIALSLSGFGLFVGIGPALAADPTDYENSGTYDEMIEVHNGTAVTPIADDPSQGTSVASAFWVPNKTTG